MKDTASCTGSCFHKEKRDNEASLKKPCRILAMRGVFPGQGQDMPSRQSQCRTALLSGTPWLAPKNGENSQLLRIAAARLGRERLAACKAGEGKAQLSRADLAALRGAFRNPGAGLPRRWLDFQNYGELGSSARSPSAEGKEPASLLQILITSCPRRRTQPCRLVKG